MARIRPSLFDYEEAEDQQLDMVDSVNRAGNMFVGLSRMYEHQDEKYADKGGFWGQMSKKGFTPKFKTLSDATDARDKMKELSGFSTDNADYKQVMSYINPAMGGDMKGKGWGEQTAKFNELFKATEGEAGSGLLGLAEKMPGVGNFIKGIGNKVAGSGLGAAFGAAQQVFGPLAMAKGAYDVLKGISDKDKMLETQGHDVGVAATAIEQSRASQDTDLHAAIRDTTNRVKEGGSQLNTKFGATALKVLSSTENMVSKSNLENVDSINQASGSDMKNVITARMDASDTLKRQANTQINRDVGQYQSATGGLISELIKNQKLGADIKDQREQLGPLVGIANAIT